jgi:hypothetical protein
MPGTDPSFYPKSPATVSVDADAVREQAERILADPLFRNSKRYSNLLRFIVDRTLKGQIDDLRERIIGIEVFRRSPDFDSSIDPTVRVAASEVRKRLALYYAEPTREQELRIEVPVRSYVAEFKVPSQSPLSSLVDEGAARQDRQSIPQQNLPESMTSSRRRWLLYASSAVVLVALVFVSWGLRRALSPGSALDEFWSPVTDGAGSVLLCIGSSSAGQSSVQPSPPAASGATRTGRNELPPQRGNVPMTDVNVAVAFDSFLRGKAIETVIRPASAASLSDLRLGPELLIGSFDNEWTMRLGADLRYRFQRESDQGLRWIENSAEPGNKDWAVDMSVPLDQRTTDYALISRVLDPTTGQWWVGIGGLTGLGTLAASQVVIDPKAMATVAPHLPKEWERKNLQVVLAVKVVQGSTGVPQVISAYSW